MREYGYCGPNVPEATYVKDGSSGPLALGLYVRREPDEHDEKRVGRQDVGAPPILTFWIEKTAKMRTTGSNIIVAFALYSLSLRA